LNHMTILTVLLAFVHIRYSFSVEGVPELTRVKVPSPPGLQLPWSSSTKRKLLTDTLEASSLSSSSSSAAAAASQAWADSTQDDGVEPSATLTSSSSPLASAPPPLPSTPSTTTSWSETEIAAMKMERFTPVNLCDVQKLLYMHGADKVVGSSLTQVDFVITVGGDTSKKVRPVEVSLSFFDLSRTPMCTFILISVFFSN